MSQLPATLREEIRQRIYERADDYHYLERSSSENGRFISHLVQDPDVGGRLREYMADADVRTYIKDAVLNRYAKERRALPEDVSPALARLYPSPGMTLDYERGNQVSLHRLEDGRVVAVARSNHLKWETGLRKLLLYVAAAPGLPPVSDTPFDLVLVIYQHGIPVNEANRHLVTRGLGLVGVNCVWV